MATGNNLKPSRLRMRSSGSRIGGKESNFVRSVREHRERAEYEDAEAAEESIRESKRRRKFKSVQEAAEVGGTFSQEKKVYGRYETNFHADCVLLKQMAMNHVDRQGTGDLFEREFLRQFEGGIVLPNVVVDDRGETKFDDTYRITRVRPVEGPDGEEYPPVVDFIAYNKDRWFALELKDQHRKPGEPLPTNMVGFRNFRQVRELVNPTKATRPRTEDPSFLVCREAKRIPSLLIKRNIIAPLRGGNGFKSVFGVYSIIPPTRLDI